MIYDTDPTVSKKKKRQKSWDRCCANILNQPLPGPCAGTQPPWLFIVSIPGSWPEWLCKLVSDLMDQWLTILSTTPANHILEWRQFSKNFKGYFCHGGEIIKWGSTAKKYHSWTKNGNQNISNFKNSSKCKLFWRPLWALESKDRMIMCDS